MNKQRYYPGIFNSVQAPLLVIDRKLRIVDANAAARKLYEKGVDEITGCPCHKATHGAEKPCHEAGLRCPVREVFATGRAILEVHRHQQADGRVVWEEVAASPVMDEQGEVAFVVEELRDLTEALKDKKLVQELQAKVETLEGLLPICSYCKRIRHPGGEWEDIEQYVRERTRAEFTHSICPPCLEKHFAEYVI